MNINIQEGYLDKSNSNSIVMINSTEAIDDLLSSAKTDNGTTPLDELLNTNKKTSSNS